MGAMGYNPKFNLDPKQPELIEDALRAERGRLARPFSENHNEVPCARQAVREITDLLAHLHHQKIWYRPKNPVPMG